jgi:exosortase C (VPDSG-CTERM-specific)
MSTTPDVQDAQKQTPFEKRPSRWPFVFASAALILGFGWTLYDLARFSLRTELFSHILLIPFVSGYLVWIKRNELRTKSAPNWGVAGALLILGFTVLAWYVAATAGGAVLAEQDRLAWKMLAFVFLFTGIAATFLGRATLRSIAFPLAFLVFLAPFPVAWVDAIESYLQHKSASAAAGLFTLAGTPFFREVTFFQLPGINIEVAPECSGIHSTLALFITSLVAGYLFLRSPIKRLLLALAVLPLAIARNGFRVFVIGELCVHISPKMIDSYIHHKGGPIFFALSLVPFFLLLFILVRLDRPKKHTPTRVMPAASV